ncbi:MAG TPA: DUF1064 domain-containing protein [Ohtaekwangia sp.]|nr:DUF1064 domain-containing protein [Ohtaekwangia sp.]
MNPQPKDKWKVPSNNLIPVASYRENYLSGVKKKNKLGNKTQMYGGIKFDSKLEARVAEDLDWRMKEGELVEIKRQVKISLDVNGVHITNYYLDFRTVDKHGQVNYIEVKGFETRHWQLKKRLFIALLPEIDNGATYEIIKA